MMTLGQISGFTDGFEEGIISFNETSKRMEPMGRFNSLAVFADRDSLQPDFGKSYYCYLRKDLKSNVYWALIQKEITIDAILDLNPDLKKDLVKLIMEEYPESFRAEVSAQQIKEFEDGIKEKYKTENAALRNQIQHLENELSKLSEISRRELQIIPDDRILSIDNGLLHDPDLEDGEFSVRFDRNGTKALVIPQKGGELYCTDGYIDIRQILDRFRSSKPSCTHCEDMGGTLILF